MNWQVLFVIGFFAILAIVSLGALITQEGSLVQVEADITVTLPEEEVAQLTDEVRGTVRTLSGEAEALLVEMRAKLEGSEHLFTQLQEAAHLLEAEAIAIKEFASTSRTLMRVAIGLLAAALVVMLMTTWIVRAQLLLMRAYTEVDLKQQRSIWTFLKNWTRRFNQGRREDD